MLCEVFNSPPQPVRVIAKMTQRHVARQTQQTAYVPCGMAMVKRQLPLAWSASAYLANTLAGGIDYIKFSERMPCPKVLTIQPDSFLRSLYYSV